VRTGTFLILAAVLFFLWIGGFVVYHAAGIAIHLLLLVAVVFVLVHLFMGAKKTS